MLSSRVPSTGANLQAGVLVMSMLPSFDLKVVADRLKRDRPELTDAQLAGAEQEYRDFLAVCKQNRGVKQTPTSQLMDDFWHAHILHTKKYAADCQTFFGYFLHHEPKAVLCSGDNCGSDDCGTTNCCGNEH